MISDDISEVGPERQRDVGVLLQESLRQRRRGVLKDEEGGGARAI